MLSFLFERKRINLKTAIPFFLQAKYPQWYLCLCDLILNLAVLFTIALEALQLADNYCCNKSCHTEHLLCARCLTNIIFNIEDCELHGVFIIS